MNKNHILEEIKRTATANGGKPLGKDVFFRETGIKYSDWYGKYWARWSDAIAEAGYTPNQLQAAYADQFIIEKLIGLIRELGRYPTTGEIRLKATQDSTFPSHGVFARLGSKRQLVQKILTYAQQNAGHSDIIALCPSAEAAPSLETVEKSNQTLGFVYLLKSGRHHKIGRTNAVGRRGREIALELPEKCILVHSISTDDPAGIEVYWHKRFESKRANGEWFTLTAPDIKAFRRRKFM